MPVTINEPACFSMELGIYTFAEATPDPETGQNH